MGRIAPRLAAVLATAAILLLLCGTLCRFDADGAGVDLCLVVLAVASVALVTAALDAAACRTPTEIRPPPPKR